MKPAGVYAPSAARRGHPALVVAVLAAFVGGAGAAANPYTVGASVSYSHDSNILQLGDDDPTPAGFSRSDSVLNTALQGGLDLPFGRQRAYANLSLRNARYGSNKVYDNNGYTVSAGLDWSTIERISGTLSANANRSLYAFNAGTGVGLITERNLQDTTGVDASVSVGLVTEYSLIVNAGHREVKNSLQTPTVQALDYQQDNASVGVRWAPRATTTFGLTLGETRGRYPKYQQLQAPETGYAADRFKQPSIEISAVVQPSGASDLDARIGYSRTRYDLNQPRDFSGVTGRIVWVWRPTGKLRLDTRLSRDTGQNAYAVTVFGTPGNSDYSQVYDTLRVQADYQVSAKISLATALQLVDRTLGNTVQTPFFPITSEGKDHTAQLSASARWAPLRSVLVGCDLTRVQRTASGTLSVPLHQNIVSCFGQFQLQQ